MVSLDPISAGGGAGLGAVIVGLFNKWISREDKKVMHEKIDRTNEKIAKVDEKHNDLALQVARDHLTKDEFRAFTVHQETGMKLLGEKIDRLNDKLDTKQDK